MLPRLVTCGSASCGSSKCGCVTCGHKLAMAAATADDTEARASGARQGQATAARAAVAEEAAGAVTGIGADTAARAAVSTPSMPEPDVALGAAVAGHSSEAWETGAQAAGSADRAAARAAASRDWPGMVATSDVVKGLRKQNKIPTPASRVHALCSAL